ncbi:MAG TPA: mechanosensitive ion channel family protein [Anaerolineales bacterium]|nr:mechanosensitive ion channel family protein [Anaerolineales bacterium]
MEPLLNTFAGDLVNPATLLGAVFYGVLFALGAILLGLAIRAFARGLELRLSDVTGVRFFGSFAQALVYLTAFVLYAHVVPDLRTLGTALLAGVSVVSVVVGFAAQQTLGNLVAGLALVFYRPFRIGDVLELNTPHGLATARVETVSLGYTVLRDGQGHEIIVPNSVMTSSVVVRRPTPSPQ